MIYRPIQLNYYISLIFQIADGLSNEPGDWGAFGAYISPILTLLTMVLLIITLNSQNKEFKYQQSQKHILELYESIVSLYEIYTYTDYYYLEISNGGILDYSKIPKLDEKYLPKYDKEKIEKIENLILKIRFLSNCFINDNKLKAKIHLLKGILDTYCNNFYGKIIIISNDRLKNKYYDFCDVTDLLEDILDEICKILSFGEYMNIEELDKHAKEFEKQYNF